VISSTTSRANRAFVSKRKSPATKADIAGEQERYSVERGAQPSVLARTVLLSHDPAAYVRAARKVLAHQRPVLAIAKCTDVVVRTLLL
jgi:hypothetical protein